MSTTFYIKAGDGTDDVLGVDSSTALAYQTGSQEGGDTTPVTITPTLEAVGFDLPPDIAVHYRSKLASDPPSSFGSWQTDNTFNLADGQYEVQAQLRYTSEGNPVVQKLALDGVTLEDVTAVSTTFTVGAPASPDWNEYPGMEIRTAVMAGGATSPYTLSASVGAFTEVAMDQSTGTSPITGVDGVNYTSVNSGEYGRTRVMQGGTNEFETAYDYMAVYNPRADIALPPPGGDQFGAPETVGWMVYVREQTPQTWENFKMSFLPLENSGNGFMPGVAYDEPMKGVVWANSGNSDANTVTFFNGYTPGDVLNWDAP